MGLRLSDLNALVPWLINGPIASPLFPKRLRGRVWRALGANIGEPLPMIEPGVTVWPHPNCVTITGRAYINTGVMLDAHSGVTIGDGVALAPRVTITTSTHEVGGSSKRTGALVRKPVVIGDGAWIGTNATILPGVTIGAGCIVAAGAVVTSDCEPDTLVAGVPAVVKRRISSTRPAS